MLVLSEVKEHIPVYEVVVDDHDTWNLNMTLASLIYPTLKAFAESNRAIPGSFLAEYGVSMSTLLPESEHEKYAIAWRRVLDTMVKAFEFIKTGKYEDDFDNEKAEVTIGLANFAKYFNNLWN